MEQTIAWLRGLAARGGKGVVNNIDARCLGRIADEIEKLQTDNRKLREPPPQFSDEELDAELGRRVVVAHLEARYK